MRKTHGDGLAQGVDIIGITAHELAVGMGVKIFDGQVLHAVKKVSPHSVEGSVGDDDHHPVIGIGTGRAGQIDTTH